MAINLKDLSGNNTNNTNNANNANNTNNAPLFSKNTATRPWQSFEIINKNSREKPRTLSSYNAFKRAVHRENDIEKNTISNSNYPSGNYNIQKMKNLNTKKRPNGFFSFIKYLISDLFL
ncbi:MAG: hypothetical protein HQK49_16990 [Oligoflexia bacterium]|nr:hypothetical protein [Oligoflexia bacterium]